MKHYLRLIRAQNLLIVAATMYLMRYMIVAPSLKHRFQPFFDVSLELQLGHFHFALLVLATVLISAAGYVINDYFDRKTDLFNRPERVVVSTYIPRRKAMLLHWIFNSLAIIISAYLSYHIGLYKLTLIFVFSAGMLWFYSTSFSKELIIGNLVVALLTAMVPMLVVLFDLPPLYAVYRYKVEMIGINFNSIVYDIGVFSLFAFVTTLAREIIKDMEDAKGDQSSGRNTLPIAAGMLVSKITVTFLITLTIAGIAVCIWNYVPFRSAYIYSATLLIAPSLVLMWLVWKAKTVREYFIASQLQKAIMLAGLLFSVLFYFIITRQSLI